MSKQEFLDTLRLKLSGLPKQDTYDRINFYSEIIDDMIEEGLTEDAAVAKIGSVDEVASQIIADTPFITLAKERLKSKKRLKTWETVLLAVGSPIWFSLAVAAFAVIISLYAALWSIVASVWAVFASLSAASVCGLFASIVFITTGNALSGLALIGSSLFCAGLAIVAFFGCLETTKATVLLTKKIALLIKKCFVKKEEER
jgi:uncharacterized membrane protein